MDKKVVELKGINAYNKDGKKFLVVETPDEKVFINAGLLNYTLDHVKDVKKA